MQQFRSPQLCKMALGISMVVEEALGGRSEDDRIEESSRNLAIKRRDRS